MRAIAFLLVAGLACAGCQQKSEAPTNDEVTDLAMIAPPGAARYEAPASDEVTDVALIGPPGAVRYKEPAAEAARSARRR